MWSPGKLHARTTGSCGPGSAGGAGREATPTAGTEGSCGKPPPYLQLLTSADVGKNPKNQTEAETKRAALRHSEG